MPLTCTDALLGMGRYLSHLPGGGSHVPGDVLVNCLVDSRCLHEDRAAFVTCGDPWCCFTQQMQHIRSAVLRTHCALSADSAAPG